MAAVGLKVQKWAYSFRRQKTRVDSYEVVNVKLA